MIVSLMTFETNLFAQFAQDVAIAMKPVLPHAIADHRDGECARLVRTIFWEERAAEDGFYLQDIKIVRGPQFGPSPVCVSF